MLIGVVNSTPNSPACAESLESPVPHLVLQTGGYQYIWSTDPTSARALVPSPSLSRYHCLIAVTSVALPSPLQSLFYNLVSDRPVLSRSSLSRALLHSLYSLPIASATSLSTNQPTSVHFTSLVFLIFKTSTPIDVRLAFFKHHFDFLDPSARNPSRSSHDHQAKHSSI